MTTIQPIITTLSSMVLACALTLGCNSKPSPSTPSATSSSVDNPSTVFPANERNPADMTMHARVVHGMLQAKTADGPWKAVRAGESFEHASAIRSVGKGAILTLADDGGQARPTVWLRGGSTINLWKTLDQGVLLQMVTGQTRVRGTDMPAYIETPSGAYEATSRDVIAYHRGDRVAVAHTRSVPGKASWSVDLEGEFEPAGFGTIEVELPRTEDQTDHTAFLELRRVDINAETAGDYAFTTVEHIFFNPTDVQLEGTFRFPLPDGAMPLGLAMEINGRMMEGEIVEREKARRTYESIVDEMQDPALLEWQQGNEFKLRVFPIEAHGEKRVILRYASPLIPTLGGFEYLYATEAPEMQTAMPAFKLSFNGRTIIDRKDFRAGQDVIVPVAGDAVPAFMSQSIAAAQGTGSTLLEAVQVRTAGEYTAVRVQPDWSTLRGDDSPKHERSATTMLVIIDTSRSALEGRDLALQTLEMVLDGLGDNDRFMLMTADITSQMHIAEPRAATADAIRNALSLARSVEPDGASDLGVAFAEAAKALAPIRGSGKTVEILYLGDGTPTWGTTEPAMLRTALDASLPNVPIHAAIIGKGASQKTWQIITSGRAGRIANPRTLAHARRFAFVVANSADIARIDNLQLTGLGDALVFPNQLTSLYRDEAFTAVLRNQAGQAPTSVTLAGTYQGQPFKQTLRVLAPASTPLIAQRWASRHIDDLQANGGDKGAIVELSKDFGVMSKHTSLLVLESEEAYKQHGIERRRALAQNGIPKVTGGDLESLGEREASLSPDHIQPGDPEIRIPAAKDAASVVVIFPFGDTKLAHFDEDADAWIARFLIDKDTPDGKYMVVVNVTHADGRIETYQLPYYVDTSAPQVELTFKPRGSKGFTVIAKQKITNAEMVSMGMDGKEIPATKKAKILSDATRVELWLPSGEILSLSNKGQGTFRRRWRMAVPLSEPVAIRVVVTDDAHNQSTFWLQVNPDGTAESVNNEPMDIVEPGTDVVNEPLS